MCNSLLDFIFIFFTLSNTINQILDEDKCCLSLDALQIKDCNLVLILIVNILECITEKNYANPLYLPRFLQQFVIQFYLIFN